MRNLMNRIETLWCEHMHEAVMWPIHGKYRCGTCLREYAVAFEAPAPGATAAHAARRPAGHSAMVRV